MAWETPTPDDVLSEFTPAEVATINGLMQGGLSITDRLQQILSRTVSEIRGYIKSGAYAVDPASHNTVPASMMVDAVALTRWRFLISVPQLKQLQTEERKNAALESKLKLQAVAAQNFTPDDPVTSTVVTSGMWNSENKIIMRTHPVTKPATQWTPQTDSYANPDAPQDAAPAA